MRSESQIRDFYKNLTGFLIFPHSADWVLPGTKDEEIKYHEVEAVIKILRWVLNNNGDNNSNKKKN